MKGWCVFFIIVAMVMTGDLQAASDKSLSKPKVGGNRERLAVLDMEAKYGIDKGIAEALSVIIRDNIDSFGDFTVMSREDLQAVASREQLLQALGCGENGQCLIDFGRAIGTRFMVAGSISKLGNIYTVSLRMLDTKGDRAGVVKRASDNCKCSEEDLVATVQNVSARLMGKEVLEPMVIRGIGEKEPSLPFKNIQSSKTEEKDNVEERTKIAEEKRKIEEAEKATLAAIAEEKRQAEEKKRLAEEQARIAEEAQKAKRAALEEKRQTVAKRKIDEEPVGIGFQQKNEASHSRKATYAKDFLDNSQILLRKEKIGVINNERLRKIIVEKNFYEKDINQIGSFNNLLEAISSEVVLDKRTELMWQRNGSADELSYYSAKIYIQKLNEKKFGGFTDWRLPTIEELASILDKTEIDGLHIDSIFSREQIRCWSNDEADPHYRDDIYQAAWITNFKSGNIVKAVWPNWPDRSDKNFANPENYVRAVRTWSGEKAEKQELTLVTDEPSKDVKKSLTVESQAPLIHIELAEQKKSRVEADIPLDRRRHELILTLRKEPKKVSEHDLISFVNEYNFFEKVINPKGVCRSIFDENGNGTVTDRSTGLMWQKSGTAKSMTIYEAQSYINDLNEQKYCGNSDWRLPTLIELASLTVQNQIGGLYIDAIFDRTQRKLWSSDLSEDYLGQSNSFDTNFILNLEKGSFVRAIFRKFNKAKGFTDSHYLVNDENFARAVRSCK